MPGIVSGEGLGLFNNLLVGLNGQSSLGQAGTGISVNAATEGEIEGLFAVNERLVMEYETTLGRMLVVMVGAMIVASSTE